MIKITDLSADDIFNTFSDIEIIAFWSKFHWSFASRFRIENKLALFQVMAWCQTSVIGHAIQANYLKDQSYKAHNSPVPCPTVYHFGKEMFTFLFQSSALWDIAIGALLHLWIRSVEATVIRLIAQLMCTAGATHDNDTHDSDGLVQGRRNSIANASFLY